jgi:predicted oxidoreductase
LQVVLAWLQTLPSNVFAILGTNQIDRIESAAKASSLKLNRQQWFSIWEASAGREVP